MMSRKSSSGMAAALFTLTGLFSPLVVKAGPATVADLSTADSIQTTELPNTGESSKKKSDSLIYLLGGSALLAGFGLSSGGGSGSGINSTANTGTPNPVFVTPGTSSLNDGVVTSPTTPSTGDPLISRDPTPAGLVILPSAPPDGNPGTDTPEPGTLALLAGAGLGGLPLLRRRKA